MVSTAGIGPVICLVSDTFLTPNLMLGKIIFFFSKVKVDGRFLHGWPGLVAIALLGLTELAENFFVLMTFLLLELTGECFSLLLPLVHLSSVVFSPILPKDLMSLFSDKLFPFFMTLYCLVLMTGSIGSLGMFTPLTLVSTSSNLTLLLGFVG